MSGPLAAVLIGSYLTRANLLLALFNGAHLDDIDDTKLVESKLSHARFVNAHLEGSDFTGATWMPDHLRKMTKQRKN